LWVTRMYVRRMGDAYWTLQWQGGVHRNAALQRAALWSPREAIRLWAFVLSGVDETKATTNQIRFQLVGHRNDRVECSNNTHRLSLLFVFYRLMSMMFGV